MIKFICNVLLIMAIAPIIIVYYVCKGIIFIIMNINKEQIYSTQFIDSADGHAFESICAGILKANKFTNVKVTKGSGDYGIDVIAEKDSIKYAIQCKHYSNNVGIAAVQQALSGCLYYGCHVPVVLTNNYFTPQAIEMAKSTNVELWDRSTLMKLNKINKEHKYKTQKSPKHPIFKKFFFWIKWLIFVFFISPFFTLPNYTELTIDEKSQTYLICLIICSYCLFSNLIYIFKKHKNNGTSSKEEIFEVEQIENDLDKYCEKDNNSLDGFIDEPYYAVENNFDTHLQGINTHSINNQYNHNIMKTNDTSVKKEMNKKDYFNADDFNPNYTTTLDEDFKEVYQSPTFIIPEENSN